MRKGSASSRTVADAVTCAHGSKVTCVHLTPGVTKPRNCTVRRTGTTTQASVNVSNSWQTFVHIIRAFFLLVFSIFLSHLSGKTID